MEQRGGSTQTERGALLACAIFRQAAKAAVTLRLEWLAKG
jgi:hypothetical protein